MRRPTPTRLILTGASIALVITAWMAFGPRQLGGSVSYVITHGNSMEPRFHEGDLVIVRRGPTYRHGDVVAYDSALLGKPVMHRIVDGGPQGFVTKGDNNHWLDSDHPTDADVLGKEWIHIPKAGKVLRQVTSPVGAAILAAIAGSLLLVGKKADDKRGERGRRTVMRKLDMDTFLELPPAQKVIAGGLALVAALALLLGVLSFAKAPVTALSSEAAYEHTGRFSYSADARRGPVYTDGKATTGEPIFLRLIDDVDVSFRYDMKTEADADITGTANMWAKVEDGTGWNHRFRIQPETSFEGTSVDIRGNLDPHEIQALIAKVEAQTGVITGSYKVTLMPSITIEGTIGGKTLQEKFAPVLHMGIEGAQMNLGATGSETASDGTPAGDPLRPVKAGSIETSELASNQLSFFGSAEISIQSARWISLWGLALALSGGYALMRSVTRQLEGTAEPQRIDARYGSWMIPVATMPSVNGETVYVADIDGLARLAERYDRMILHEEREGSHRYFVEEAGVLYCYDPTPRKRVHDVEPSPPRRVATRSSGSRLRARRAARAETEDTKKTQ